FAGGEEPAQLIRKEGLGQVSDTAEITAMVEQALEKNRQAAADYQAGQDRALDRLVGAVMAMSKGRANVAMVNQLLRERLPRTGG
ncbi:MAG: Asp-tRNA(Asn)/Glu-tRNA(Gln) amidotransferase GatCAB subunit B, partial [Candidatus Dormiibacterota bacterium]